MYMSDWVVAHNFGIHGFQPRFGPKLATLYRSRGVPLRLIELPGCAKGARLSFGTIYEFFLEPLKLLLESFNFLDLGPTQKHVGTF